MLWICEAWGKEKNQGFADLLMGKDPGKNMVDWYPVGWGSPSSVSGLQTWDAYEDVHMEVRNRPLDRESGVWETAQSWTYLIWVYTDSILKLWDGMRFLGEKEKKRSRTEPWGMPVYFCESLFQLRWFILAGTYYTLRHCAKGDGEDDDDDIRSVCWALHICYLRLCGATTVSVLFSVLFQRLALCTLLIHIY